MTCARGPPAFTPPCTGPKRCRRRPDVPFGIVLVAAPFVTLAALLPVTLNGIGLREFAYVLLFAGSGIANETAVIVSLLQFSLIALMSTVGFVIHAAELRRTDSLPQK